MPVNQASKPFRELAVSIVEHGPLMVVNPLPEDMIHGFPMGKVGGQVTPRAATFDQIEDGIDDAPPILGRASAFGGFGQHRFEVSPLGVGEVGVVSGDFHRPTGAAANESPKTSQSYQAFFSFIWRSCLRKHSGFLFQTYSYVQVGSGVHSGCQTFAYYPWSAEMSSPKLIATVEHQIGNRGQLVLFNRDMYGYQDQYGKWWWGIYGR
jgi:hypothetical protein